MPDAHPNAVAAIRKIIDRWDTPLRYTIHGGERVINLYGTVELVRDTHADLMAVGLHPFVAFRVRCFVKHKGSSISHPYAIMQSPR